MYNEIDRKIDVTAILFLLVENRQQTHDWTLIGSGANGLGLQECPSKGMKGNDGNPDMSLHTPFQEKQLTLKTKASPCFQWNTQTILDIQCVPRKMTVGK